MSNSWSSIDFEFYCHWLTSVWSGWTIWHVYTNPNELMSISIFLIFAFVNEVVEKFFNQSEDLKTCKRLDLGFFFSFSFNNFPYEFWGGNPYVPNLNWPRLQTTIIILL